MYIHAYDSDYEDEVPFRKYHDGNYTPYNEWNSNEIIANDTFEIRFDFKSKSCSFHYNGKFVCILHDKLPEKLYPAIACAIKAEFECTKWDLSYSKH